MTRAHARTRIWLLGVTLFGLVFTPVFYMVVRGLADRSSREKKPAPIG